MFCQQLSWIITILELLWDDGVTSTYFGFWLNCCILSNYQLFWNYDSIFSILLAQPCQLHCSKSYIYHANPCHKFSFSSGTSNNHQQLCLLWPVPWLVYRMQHIHGWEFNSHYTPVPSTPTSLVGTACLDESWKWTCFLATQNCEGPRDLSLRYIPLLHAQKSQTIKSNIVVLWCYCALFAIHIPVDPNDFECKLYFISYIFHVSNFLGYFWSSLMCWCTRKVCIKMNLSA